MSPCPSLLQNSASDLFPQNVLKESNRATLDAVSAFVRDAATTEPPAVIVGKIPAALIVTGPNIASQDLLFSQLGSDDRHGGVGGGRFVRLRAAEAPNLKAALRKIVRDVVARALVEEGSGDGELAVGKDVSWFLFPFFDSSLGCLVAVLCFVSSTAGSVSWQQPHCFVVTPCSMS